MNSIYFVIEIQNDSVTLIYRFADDDAGATRAAIDRALEKFHTVMAYRDPNGGRTSTTCTIIDITGGTVKKERYVASEITPVAE